MPDTLYVVASGEHYSLRTSAKVIHKGSMERPLRSLDDQGLLAGELTLMFKLPRMPVVLQVHDGGKSVKPLLPLLPVILPPSPEGPKAS